MQNGSPHVQACSFGLEDLRGLSHEFVREFLSIQQECSPAVPGICLVGCELQAIEFLVAQMVDELAQYGCNGVRIEVRTVRAEPLNEASEMDTPMYRLDVDYFLGHLVKSPPHNSFSSDRSSV